MNTKNPGSKEQRSSLDTMSMPKHVAIIMDGNGRWAIRRGLPRIAGHKKGTDAVRRVTDYCRHLGISVLTLYAFSDENWGRPKEEVAFLMDRISSFLKAEIETMRTKNVRFRSIGRIERLPLSAQNWIKKAVTETAGNTGLILNLALSYGGRGEILEAIRRMHAANGKADPLTEELFSSFLDTGGLPDPDLIIRTSGEKRISNFLLWQTAYAELYFTDKIWPDFEEKDLLDAKLDFIRKDSAGSD